jgi:hypothetical protein
MTRAPIRLRFYVAGPRVNLLLASSGCAPDCTRRPAPGVLPLGFGAWRIACDKNSKTGIMAGGKAGKESINFSRATRLRAVPVGMGKFTLCAFRGCPPFLKDDY